MPEVGFKFAGFGTEIAACVMLACEEIGNDVTFCLRLYWKITLDDWQV